MFCLQDLGGTFGAVNCSVASTGHSLVEQVDDSSGACRQEGGVKTDRIILSFG